MLFAEDDTLLLEHVWVILIMNSSYYL